MIACNAFINFGQPALQGRRLTVYDIVTKIYYEANMKIALDDYEISLKDAMDAVFYCKTLKCKEDKDLVRFCDGCMLRTIQEGWNFRREDYLEVEREGSQVVISKNRQTLFIGSLQEFEDSEFGKVTWLIAEEVYKKYIKK